MKIQQSLYFSKLAHCFSQVSLVLPLKALTLFLLVLSSKALLSEEFGLIGLFIQEKDSRIMHASLDSI